MPLSPASWPPARPPARQVRRRPRSRRAAPPARLRAWLAACHLPGYPCPSRLLTPRSHPPTHQPTPPTTPPTRSARRQPPGRQLPAGHCGVWARVRQPRGRGACAWGGVRVGWGGGCEGRGARRGAGSATRSCSHAHPYPPTQPPQTRCAGAQAGDAPPRPACQRWRGDAGAPGQDQVGGWVCVVCWVGGWAFSASVRACAGARAKRGRGSCRGPRGCAGAGAAALASSPSHRLTHTTRAGTRAAR